jgi:Cys-rich protein (TIGR01571 family)
MSDKEGSSSEVKIQLQSEFMVRSPGQADDALLCGEKNWSFGLFDGCCNGGIAGFCMRWFCSACMYGRAVGLALDGNCLLCCWFNWYGLPCCRSKLREKYNIEGGNLGLDILKCCLCYPCTIQQFIHEVNSREGKHIGPFGDPEGTWNLKADCGKDIPGANVGTNIGNSMER